MDRFLMDLRYALRILIRQPGAAIVIALTLGIGIGANISVFTLANALFLRPLTARDPGKLVRLYSGETAGDYSVFSYPNFKDFESRATLLSGIAAHRETPATVTIGGAPENLSGELVSGNYFSVLGLRTSLGRALDSQDDLKQNAVVVLSNDLWTRRLNSDPNVLGRSIFLNGNAFEVIGVLQDGFRGSYETFAADFWVPLSTHELVRPRGISIDRRGWGWLSGTGRLKPGVHISQAREEARRISSDLAREYPRSNRGTWFFLTPASGLPENLSTALRKAVGFLGMIVAALLLVACANVAGILLSRFFARGQEILIRHSLGAGRMRLASQFLTETSLLAAIGGAVGVAIAAWTGDAWNLLLPQEWFGTTLEINVDGITLAFAVVASALTVLLSSAAPLLRLRALDLNAAIKEEKSSAKSRTRLFDFFVTGQFAICTLLLIVSVLLLRSLEKSMAFAPGFDIAQLLVGSVDLQRSQYSEVESSKYLQNAMQRLSALPGVTSVSYARVVPLGYDQEEQQFQIPSYAPPQGEPGITIDFNVAGPKYFETMGIPLLPGSRIQQWERNSPASVVINETMARKFFGNENAVGKRIKQVEGQEFEVAAVARDIKYYSLGEEARPYVYFPASQDLSSTFTFAIRTSVPPANLTSTVFGELQRLDPRVAPFEVMTFDQVRSRQLYPIRALAALSSLFGSLAVVLTAVGIYGVVSYSVRRRTREIGVRMALGAGRTDILRMVLQKSTRLTVLGLLLGALVAAVVTRFLSGLLFGVSALDPVSFAVTALFLFFIGITATMLPALRASRVEPSISLRYE